MTERTTNRLATLLKDLRQGRGWSLDQLAVNSGVSRASLSRVENASVSPTADVLARLCASFDVSMSHLMMQVEGEHAAFIPFADQPEWEDPDTGFERREVSPRTGSFAADVQECHLPPDVVYPHPKAPKPRQEHHLILLDGALSVTVDDTTYNLTAGDCVRYHFSGAGQFSTNPDRGARFLLVQV